MCMCCYGSLLLLTKRQAISLEFHCESFNNREVYKKKSFNNCVFLRNIEIYFLVKGRMKTKKERKVIQVIISKPTVYQ